MVLEAWPIAWQQANRRRLTLCDPDRGNGIVSTPKDVEKF
jgi:hypothetical protein